VLGLYLWAVLGGRPDGEVRSIALATLVFGNLALILVNRSWRLPIWSSFRHRRNAALPWILLGALALLAALLSVPWLRTAFGLGPISIGEAAAAFVAGLAGVAWFEVYKVVGRLAR
jgi:Ca2+-transporting ATPase